MEQSGDPMPILINRMKQRRRDIKVKAMLTVLLSQESGLVYNFGNAPPLLFSLSFAHTIIADTHVGRATQLIFGSTPAQRKSRADCFFVTLGIDCQICARRYRRMHG